MFGDELIIGHSTGKMDPKYRIFIPKFTNVSVGDQIITKMQKEDNSLKLIAYQEYFKIIERLKILRDNSTSFEDYEKFNKKLEDLCLNLASFLKVDTQKRILIPRNITDEFDWHPGETFQFDGIGNGLLIRKTQNK